jgi:hypothetical protein
MVVSLIDNLYGGKNSPMRKLSAYAVNALQSSDSDDKAMIWTSEKGLSEDDLLGKRPAHWYTGLLPSRCPGFNAESETLHSLPLVNLNSCSKQAVKDYFNNTWTLTEVLYSALQTSEAFMLPPPHNLRHPLIFYYGHPAVLYVNKLRLAGLIERPINSYFESIFVSLPYYPMILYLSLILIIISTQCRR